MLITSFLLSIKLMDRKNQWLRREILFLKRCRVHRVTFLKNKAIKKGKIGPNKRDLDKEKKIFSSNNKGRVSYKLKNA